MTEKLTFTLFHDPARGTLTLPRAALRLSRLSGARRLKLLACHGGLLLLRDVPTVREAVALLRLLSDRSVSLLLRLSFASHGAEEVPAWVDRLQGQEAQFLALLEHSGVDLEGLQGLLRQEGEEDG